MLDYQEQKDAQEIATKAAMWIYNGLDCEALKKDIDNFIGRAPKAKEIKAEARKLFKGIKLENHGKFITRSFDGKFIYTDSIEFVKSGKMVSWNWVANQL